MLRKYVTCILIFTNVHHSREQFSVTSRDRCFMIYSTQVFPFTMIISEFLLLQGQFSQKPWFTFRMRTTCIQAKKQGQYIYRERLILKFHHLQCQVRTTCFVENHVLLVC